MTAALAAAAAQWPTAAQAHCRGPSCRAPILWALSEHGIRHPIDPTPADDGIVFLAVDRDGVTVRSRYETTRDAHRTDPRYTLHHATCRDRRLWIRLQSTDPGSDL